jgi:cytochrome bd-type quinol oxidase subunit 2
LTVYSPPQRLHATIKTPPLQAEAFYSTSQPDYLSICEYSLFPYVLPSTFDPSLGLTVDQAAAPLRSLEIGLAWFVPGLLLAIVYLFVSYRSFAGKVGVIGEGY